MKTYTIEQLKILRVQWLNTLDDQEDFEMYGTSRSLSVCDSFLDWLAQQEKNELKIAKYMRELADGKTTLSYEEWLEEPNWEEDDKWINELFNK